MFSGQYNFFRLALVPDITFCHVCFEFWYAFFFFFFSYCKDCTHVAIFCTYAVYSLTPGLSDFTYQEKKKKKNLNWVFLILHSSIFSFFTPCVLISLFLVLSSPVFAKHILIFCLWWYQMKRKTKCDSVSFALPIRLIQSHCIFWFSSSPFSLCFSLVTQLQLFFGETYTTQE